MLKGIDELAKACEPAAPESGSAPAAALELSEEQIDKIAARMIEKLQNNQPEEEPETKDPDPEEISEPGPEEKEEV